MKRTTHYIVSAVALVTLIALFSFWKSGNANPYLPFFLTTDGWNKVEREMNTNIATGTNQVTGTNPKEPEPIVVKDFEGEANPDMMTLSMTEWFWVRSHYNDGKVVHPTKEKTFSLTFKEGRVMITTDCNRMSANYVTEGNKITFKDMTSTRMYCEGSQESEFSKMLEQISGYMFTSKGELVLLFAMDSGSMIFR